MELLARYLASVFLFFFMMAVFARASVPSPASTAVPKTAASQVWQDDIPALFLNIKPDNDIVLSGGDTLYDNKRCQTSMAGMSFMSM